LTWTELEEMPLGLQPVGTPAAYDTESDSVVFLQTAAWRFETDVVSTWVYDTDEATWTEMTPEPHPRLGMGARMVYDSESDRIIAHGGAAVSGDSFVLTRETWAYDYNTNTWEELNPSTEPPGINYHAMAYDSESDRTVLFGLNDLTGETLLWAFDYNTTTWEEMPLTEGPAGASVYTRAVYDPVSDRILVFGGQHMEELDLVAHNELWSYDYNTNTWEQRASNESSGPVANHAMVRVDSSGAVVVFGGGPSTNDTDFAGNDLWVYDPATDTWTSG
jgi:N-acetylneuraminic acid mutarotase